MADEILSTTFSDSEGTQWTVPCDLNAIVRVQKETGINLTDLVNQNSDSFRLWSSEFPMIHVQVLYSLLSEQASHKGLEPEDIGKRLASQDAFDDALRCVYNAVVNFSPRPRRKWLTRAFQQAEAAFDRLVNQEAAGIEESLERTDWDATLTQTLAQLDSATGSQESSESTPDRELSASLT